MFQCQTSPLDNKPLSKTQKLLGFLTMCMYCPFPYMIINLVHM